MPNILSYGDQSKGTGEKVGDPPTRANCTERLYGKKWSYQSELTILFNGDARVQTEKYSRLGELMCMHERKMTLALE